MERLIAIKSVGCLLFLFLFLQRLLPPPLGQRSERKTLVGRHDNKIGLGFWLRRRAAAFPADEGGFSTRCEVERPMAGSSRLIGRQVGFARLCSANPYPSRRQQTTTRDGSLSLAASRNQLAKMSRRD